MGVLGCTAGRGKDRNGLCEHSNSRRRSWLVSLTPECFCLQLLCRIHVYDVIEPDQLAAVVRLLHFIYGSVEKRIQHLVPLLHDLKNTAGSSAAKSPASVPTPLTSPERTLDAQAAPKVVPSESPSNPAQDWTAIVVPAPHAVQASPGSPTVDMVGILTGAIPITWAEADKSLLQYHPRYSDPFYGYSPDDLLTAEDLPFPDSQAGLLLGSDTASPLASSKTCSLPLIVHDERIGNRHGIKQLLHDQPRLWTGCIAQP